MLLVPISDKRRTCVASVATRRILQTRRHLSGDLRFVETVANLTTCGCVQSQLSHDVAAIFFVNKKKGPYQYRRPLLAREGCPGSHGHERLVFAAHHTMLRTFQRFIYAANKRFQRFLCMAPLSFAGHIVLTHAWFPATIVHCHMFLTV
jgi:hypothetical protein